MSRQFLQSIQDGIQGIINYISGGFTRIFGPRDDNYPNTGVQPFEGDPADDKRL
jgi:hypothetical protein